MKLLPAARAHPSRAPRARGVALRAGRVRWRRLLVIALLLPLLAELGVRAALALSGVPYSAADAHERISRFASELGAPPDDDDELQRQWLLHQTSLHPFVAFESERGRDEIAALAPYVRLVPPEQRARQFVILFLGGSVSDYFGEWGFEALRAELAADPRLAGRELVLLRHGRPAFKAPQPLFLCAWLFELGIVPDAVVLIDGFNEVALANYNASVGVHPAYPSIYHWGALARGLSTEAGFDQALRIRQAREDALALCERTFRCAGGAGLRSALYGFAQSRRIEHHVLEWRALNSGMSRLAAANGTDPVTAGPPFDHSHTLAIAVDTWERQSRAIDALCRGFGARFLHVLQPTLYDEGSKSLTDEEREHGAAFPEVIEGTRCGYPLLRERLAVLAGADIRVFDASGVFREHPETLYFDLCHFERAGNAILAAAIAPAVRDLIPERPR
jgi:hypothetical protein